MFVIHFAADLHQPMHVSDNGDQGGNQVDVSYFGRRTRLHALWDSGILRRMGGEDQLLAYLQRELTPQKAAGLARGSVESWAQESKTAAREVAYGRLPQRPKGTVILLSEPYARFAEPVTREQLERAGARLASLLNEALR